MTCLMVNATPFTFCTPAHERFIHLNWALIANRITLRTHKTGTYFVKHLERRFIALEAELSLELKCRLSGCLRGHKIGTPKPHR